MNHFAKGHKHELKMGGRAVIYQRVSSKEQESGFSPETQLEICNEWAARHNYEVVKTFGGESESAKTDTKRKRFNEVLKFVLDKNNKIDAVIVYMTNRLSRTGMKSFSIVDKLLEKGIPVFSASSSYDARTPDGKLMQGMELLMANHDNTIKSQAVKDNGARALRSGRWIQAPPRGYDMKTTRAQQTITVNTEGDLIRRAFMMKADENLTNEEIRVKMKAMGLDLPKQRWSTIFRNIFYAGYFSHPFLEGEVIKGPHKALVSLEVFLKVNGMLFKAHNRGYEAKTDKEYAPLLGSLKCPVCGHNLTASLSTKMRKKYGRDIGYYVCSRKDCKCNVAAKRANEAFEEWVDGVALPEAFSVALEAQLRKAFPTLNKQGQDEVSAIKATLSKKESEIERIEYNLATAANARVLETCTKTLAKAEGERDKILRELQDKDKEILNLDDYIKNGMDMRNNILKLWRLSDLTHKRLIQNLIFPEGIVWDKKNDDIEPRSKNEFLFTWGSKSGGYEDKENGQTVVSDDLSALAPQLGLEPRTL